MADAPPPPDDGPDEPATCDTAYGPPTGVHQVLTATPETSRKIVWSAPLHPMGAVLEYRPRSTTAWKSLHAAPESSDGCNAIWSATLTGLSPTVFYDYRVSGASAQGRVLSDTFAVRTGSAPTAPPLQVRVRRRQRLEADPAVAARCDASSRRSNYLAYPLVLGGGGYAHSTEAIAAGAASNSATAVAAWKRQASVVTVELDLRAGARRQRGGRTASARRLRGVHARPGRRRAAHRKLLVRLQRNALRRAARAGSRRGAPEHRRRAPRTWPGSTPICRPRAAAGARWIVVYMHADVFSSERVEAGTEGVRKALGEILQRHRVNLVLSGDGTSYERSLALSGPARGPDPRRDRPRSVTTATDGIVFVRAGSGGRTAFGAGCTRLPTWSAFREQHTRGLPGRERRRDRSARRSPTASTRAACAPSSTRSRSMR